jgi:hypothetical protein
MGLKVEEYFTQADLLPLSHQDIEEDKYRSGWYTQQKVDGIYYCLSLGGSSETLDIEIASTGAEISITWANVPLEEVTAILLGCLLGTGCSRLFTVYLTVFKSSFSTLIH